jgi:hypothetical protein
MNHPALIHTIDTLTPDIPVIALNKLLPEQSICATLPTRGVFKKSSEQVGRIQDKVQT